MKQQASHRSAARAGTKLGIPGGLLKRISARLQGEPLADATIPDLAITDEPTAADIARARELIKEYGWTHLLRPES